MKAVVSKEDCIGCQLCESIAPEVFHRSEDGFTSQGSEFGEDALADVEEAADSCPTEAISIED